MAEGQDLLGLGLSSGFKFDPDDDELVEHFLLRRILGQQPPLEGMILEDDPLSTPPYVLVDEPKPKDEAFFFTNGQTIHGKGSRQKRTCVGGSWEGQKVVVDGDKLRLHYSGKEITWRKYMLNFHTHGEVGSSGWVMHEYSITAPVDLASSPLRLYRIRFSGHGKNSKRKPDGYCGGARAAKRQARADAEEPDLHEEHISAANSVFPPVALHGGSAWPPATSFSDQDYQPYQGVNVMNDRPPLDSFQDFVQPDSTFLPGADLGYYTGPAAVSTHQDFLGGGNAMDVGAHGATASYYQEQEAQGVMNEYDGATPAAGMLPFCQGSSFGEIDEELLDIELQDQDFNFDDVNLDFNFDEFVFPDPCSLEAPLHDQYSSVGMATQSQMQLMTRPGPQLHTLVLRLDVSWLTAAHTTQHSAKSPFHPKSPD